MIEKIKYIHDIETMMSLDIQEVMIATGLWEPRGKNVHHLEHKKKNKPRTNVFPKDNSCTCKDCGFHANSPLDVARHYKGSFSEGLKWLHEAYGIKRVPNPDYVPSPEEKRKWVNIVKKHTKNKPSTSPNLPKKKESIIKHDSFSPSMVRSVDFEKGLKIYSTLNYKNRLMIVYTTIYNFSKEGDDFMPLEYFNSRGIKKRKNMDPLGYIPVSRFSELELLLKSMFPIEDLIEFKVLTEEDHSKPLKFKLHYVKRGGLIVYPSFHKYFDLVTGFMFRPTNPESWMVESHLKEIQMTNNEICNSLPFGFTKDFIMHENAIKCVVEGGPDSHCCPEHINGKEMLFISSPGAGNLKEVQLGLLRGQTLRFMYDQDKAGRAGFWGDITLRIGLINSFIFPRDKDGLKELQEKKEELKKLKEEFYELVHDGDLHKCLRAGVTPEVCQWDSQLGDLNDILKQINKKTIPCSNMEEFLLKFVSVKKIK